jgi:Zn-finger nucleic acid-binding protein
MKFKQWKAPTHNEQVDAQIAQLHTGYESDRRHAASELGRMQDERAIPELLFAAMAEPSDMLLRQIGQSLEKFEGSLVFPALLENVLSTENPVKTSNSISLLWAILPDCPAHLHPLQKVMVSLERLPQPQKGEVWAERGRLREVYERWVSHLQQKCRQEHEGMQRPPKRFRNLTRKNGRQNTASISKAANGGRIK